MQTVHLTSHAFTCATVSHAWLKLTLQCSLCALSPKHSSSHAHVMFRTLLDPPQTSPSQSTPTLSALLFPSHWPTTCTAQTGLLFCGRFAEQSPLTGYELNAPVEVSSTETKPIILPSRKGSIGWTCNSVDGLTTTSAVREICERSDLGMLASSQSSQERERQMRTHSKFITPIESSATSFLHFRSGTGKPVARCPNVRKSSRDSGVLQNSHSGREKGSF